MDTDSKLYKMYIKQLQLRTFVPGVNLSVMCTCLVSISTSSSIVDGLSCKKLTESIYYMVRKHADVIEKKPSTLSTKRVLLLL